MPSTYKSISDALNNISIFDQDSEWIYVLLLDGGTSVKLGYSNQLRQRFHSYYAHPLYVGRISQVLLYGPNTDNTLERTEHQIHKTLRTKYHFEDMTKSKETYLVGKENLNAFFETVNTIINENNPNMEKLKPTSTCYMVNEIITPEIAKEYLKKNINGNRPVREKVVDFYAKQMLAGEWVNNGQAITFDVNGNMVDGQHRLLAVIKSGCNVEMSVTRDVSNKSFATIDHGLKRTISDTFNVLGVDDGRLKANIAMSYIALKNNRTDTSKAQRSYGMSDGKVHEEYLSKQELYDSIATTLNKIKAKRSSFSGAFYKDDVGGLIAYAINDAHWDKEKVFGWFQMLADETDNNPYAIGVRRAIVNDRLSSKNMHDRYTKEQRLCLYTQGLSTYLKGNRPKARVRLPKDLRFNISEFPIQSTKKMKFQ